MQILKNLDFGGHPKWDKKGKKKPFDGFYQTLANISEKKINGVEMDHSLGGAIRAGSA